MLKAYALGCTNLDLLNDPYFYLQIIFSAIMNVIGATLKLFGCISQIPNPGRFAFVFVGQAIAGISQTLFMGSPPKVASNWFQIKERTLATAVISLVNPIGIAIGTYLSPAIVKEPDELEFKGFALHSPNTVNCS